jgi:two-component system NtrC family sensor kinase
MTPDNDNRRILLVDDMPAIHEDFCKILAPATPARSALDATRALLFDEQPSPPPSARFELESVYQGQEALARVDASVRERRPYAMAFVDMRMPPGWDGVETIERLWAVDPRLQVVICTAYSDTSWEEVLQRLDARDRLLVLKKPFDTIEVRQLASALCAKWRMAEREVDERRHLESQLVQAERLASIGQLAAGVAHEINNPIGYISSNFATLESYLSDLMEVLSAYEAAEGRVGAELALQLRRLRERLQLDELKADVAGLMGESREGIQRVRQIVQDLKDFSRVDSGQEWQWADLHKGIDSTLNIVASEVRYKAEVVKRYGTLPEVWCLPSQLNQVVLNLVLNAAQAIGSERGEIVIGTGVERDSVWIDITDTGSGIAPENRSRIFDPFFTTKPVGQGTGLGLSLSYGIVQKHRGRIDVDSAVGRGSRFRVWLPVRPAEEDAAMAC